MDRRCDGQWCSPAPDHEAVGPLSLDASLPLIWTHHRQGFWCLNLIGASATCCFAGPPAGAAPANTPALAQAPLLALPGCAPAGPAAGSAPQAQRTHEEEQHEQQGQQPQQQQQPKPASAPVESQAAEVLALLAGEGSEAAGGAATGAAAAGAAVAGQPIGALPGW